MSGEPIQPAGGAVFSFTRQEQLVLGVLAGTFAIGLAWTGWQRHRAVQTLAAYEASYDALDRRVDSLARAAAPAVPPAEASAPAAEAEPRDVNRITAAQLETLPRIGPVLAGRILAYRTRVGRIDSLDQLLAVRGIGPKTLETIRPYLRVD